jgi:hypothetical protein
VTGRSLNRLQHRGNGGSDGRSGALDAVHVNGALRAGLRGSRASEIFCKHQADGDEGQQDVCEQQQGNDAGWLDHGCRWIRGRRSSRSDDRGWLG